MLDTWEMFYEQAILETDAHKMPGRIRAACEAIDSRLSEAPPAQESDRLVRAGELLVSLGHEAEEWPNHETE